MRKSIKGIFEKWACKHRWTVFEKKFVQIEGFIDRKATMRYILFCKKCGKIKKMDII